MKYRYFPLKVNSIEPQAVTTAGNVYVTVTVNTFMRNIHIYTHIRTYISVCNGYGK